MHSYSTNACFDEKFSLAIKKCKSNDGSVMELFFTVTVNRYVQCIYTSVCNKYCIYWTMRYSLFVAQSHEGSVYCKWNPVCFVLFCSITMEDEGRQKKVEVGREKVSMFELITLTSLNVRLYVCVCFFYIFQFVTYLPLLLSTINLLHFVSNTNNFWHMRSKFHHAVSYPYYSNCWPVPLSWSYDLCTSM